MGHGQGARSEPGSAASAAGSRWAPAPVSLGGGSPEARSRSPQQHPLGCSRARPKRPTGRSAPLASPSLRLFTVLRCFPPRCFLLLEELFGHCTAERAPLRQGGSSGAAVGCVWAGGEHTDTRSLRQELPSGCSRSLPVRVGHKRYGFEWLVNNRELKPLGYQLPPPPTSASASPQCFQGVFHGCFPFPPSAFQC